MPGQRYTSDRRRAPGQGRAGGNAVPLSGSRRAKAARTSAGPLSYEGDDAVECPDCGATLDPNRKGAGPGSVPKHARFGWPTSVKGHPPCRGYVAGMPTEE